ncbi:MAG: formate dehydrogenase subunit gamma [Candidatus Saccharibacteria bacterium]
MELLTKFEPEVERVERFSYSARFAHWGHTVTFLLCLFTGLLLFLDSWVGGPDGMYVAATWLHRLGAIGFTIIPLVCLAANFEGFVEWIKDVLNFGMNDIKFLMVFPLEFLGFHVNIPPQTKFNGGEKMNSVVTTTSCIIVALSGYIMWVPSLWSPGFVAFAYICHDIFMALATTMVCMHGYLGSFHPGSGESLWGMVDGTVKSEWAEHHHKAWYDKVTGKDTEE